MSSNPGSWFLLFLSVLRSLSLLDTHNLEQFSLSLWHNLIYYLYCSKILTLFEVVSLKSIINLPNSRKAIKFSKWFFCTRPLISFQWFLMMKSIIAKPQEELMYHMFSESPQKYYWNCILLSLFNFALHIKT